MTTKLVYLIPFLFLVSCMETYTPKPRGYFRIGLPEKEYRTYQSDCPYSFEYPVYGKIETKTKELTEKCWLNVTFPQFKGKIHLSYKPVTENIDTLLNDSHTLAYKHTIKADAINEKLFLSTEKKVYGILYEIKGNAASALQFHLTDSSHHFIRGSLYFNTRPNADSLAPIINFLKKDIIYMVESFHWN